MGRMGCRPCGVDPAGACPAVQARGGGLLAAVVVAQGAAQVACLLCIPLGEPAGESGAYGFHKMGFQLLAELVVVADASAHQLGSTGRVARINERRASESFRRSENPR